MFKDCSEEELKALYADMMTSEKQLLYSYAEKLVAKVSVNVMTLREALDVVQESFLMEVAKRYFGSK